MFDDLFSAGLVGVARALKSYDPGRGANLCTWAVWCIRRELSEVLRVEKTQRAQFISEWEDDSGEKIVEVPDPIVGVDIAEPADWERYFRYLTRVQRRVFEMYYVQGLDMAAISARLKITKQAVSHAHRLGLRRLREPLACRREELCNVA